MGIAVSDTFFKCKTRSIHARNTARAPNCQANPSKQKHPSD